MNRGKCGAKRHTRATTMRRPAAEPVATFAPSDVYRIELMGLDRFTAEHGAPSPELLAAVEDHRAWQSGLGGDHRRRTPADWRDDAPGPQSATPGVC